MHWSYNDPIQTADDSGLTAQEAIKASAWLVFGLSMIRSPKYIFYRTTECQGVCSSEQSAKKCEPQFVQKRLVALHPSGHKLISELFWFPATCRCVVK